MTIEVEIEGLDLILEFPDGTDKSIIDNRVQALVESGGTDTGESIRQMSLWEQAKEKIGEQRGLGANIGGATGGALGVPLAIASKNPAAVPASAVIGGSAGEAIEQSLFKLLNIPTAEPLPGTPIEAMQNINRAGAQEGVAETIGGSMGPLISKLGRANRPLTREAVLAKEHNLPISPSSVGGGKVAKTFEWLGESLPTGKAWVQHKRRQLSDSLVKMTDDIRAKLPLRADKFEAGSDLYEGVKAAKKTLGVKRKAAYDAFEESLGGKTVNMTKTWETIDDIIESKSYGLNNKQRAFLEAFRDKSAMWDASDVDDYQKQIWSTFRKKHPDIAKKLTNTLKEDIGEEATGRLELARKEHIELMTFSKNPTVKRIVSKYRTDPENVILTAFRSGNMDDVNAIKNAVEPKVWDTAKGRFVENIVDASIKYEGPNAIFEPLKFVKNFEKYQRQIENVMPEIYDNMNDFYLMVKASVPDLKSKEMTKFSTLWHSVAGVGMVGGSYVSPAAIADPASFSAIIAKSVMNPRGWVRKYAVEGFKSFGSETTKSALKVGSRPASELFVSDESEKPQKTPRLGLTK